MITGEPRSLGCSSSHHVWLRQQCRQDVRGEAARRLEPGHGQLAWNALIEKYNGHTKEARRACHNKLVNTKTEPGQDSGDLFFVLDECRNLFEELRQTARDERYEDIILQGLSLNYERVRTASYDRRYFWLDDISAHGTHYFYVDNLSCSVNAASALPCRWWGTPAVTCRATTAKYSDTLRATAPSLRGIDIHRPNPGESATSAKTALDKRHGRAESGDARTGGDRNQRRSFP